MRGMKTGIRGEVAAAVFWTARGWGEVVRWREGVGVSDSAHWAMERESEITWPEGRMVVGTV